MRTIFLCLGTLCLLSISMFNSAIAQRDCGTMEYLYQQENLDPKRTTKMEQIELHTRQFTQNQASRAVNGVITIPVVVHVVYNTSAENISDAQILSQIAVLNEDFRRTNSDANNTWSQAEDSEIEFCMATVDPNGNATNGITRTSTSTSAFGTNDNMKFNSSGGKDAWPAGDYLNMWVCDISGGILGYAQFPGGSASTDGVVIDYQYMGTTGTATAPFDLGRTTTHEVGHWLNLRHIWGDGNCNVDDFVSDTPSSDGANYGCATGHSSCGTTDMVENYMDYSDDACMNLFTAGQNVRMRALFDTGGFRESLLNSAACGTPPPPATCNDGIQNQGETAIDCGGPNCNPCPCSGTMVTVSITLDNYPEETAWTITDGGGVVASGGTYGSQADGSTVNIDVCLADGCYDFQITDTYGDGICCAYGSGSYSVTGGGNTLASGGSFASSETTNFCLGGGPAPTCSDGIQNQGETGIDCGGPCDACPPVPTCDDGIQNQGETGIDCGGPCDACPPVPTCDDGIQNQGETGIDCGGPNCDPCSTGCTTVSINNNGFESGWGIWNDGGSDARRDGSSTYATTGSYSIRLRDNTSTSVMTTDNLNLAGFTEVTIDFNYRARSMENNEDFWLQASTNGGSSYTTLVSWARGTDFNNNQHYSESVTITGTFTSTTKFRFRCDASGNGDYVYIDDVNITGCQNGARTSGDASVEAPLVLEDSNINEFLPELSNVLLFPNPTRDLLQVDFKAETEAMKVNVFVTDMTGKVVMEQTWTTQEGKQRQTLDMNRYEAGIYMIHMVSGSSRISQKFVVIK